MSITSNQAADILVIDDEQVVRDAVTKICALDSYSVHVAENVETAAIKISEGFYPIIICDIMMPDGNGFDILETLTSLGIDSTVILMTGYSTVENAVEAFFKGSTDFIPKPFTVDELLSAVFRARNLQKLKERQRQFSLLRQPDEIPFVPCPAKYFRLGHSSWISLEREGLVLMGVCDLFLKTIESVRDIEFLGVRDELIQGTSSTMFTANDGRLHKMLSPISGRITKINTSLQKSPQLIEKDPYFEGWIYGIIPANLEYEVKHLIPCVSDRL